MESESDKRVADAKGPRSSERDKLSRVAAWLVAATLVYNVVEGIVAVWWGSNAGSSALVAFGLDSGIESLAAAVLLWRLKAGHAEDTELGERREAVAVRLVGITFLLLAAYIVGEAGWTLFSRSTAEESPAGIVLAVLSLLIMPCLAWAKLGVAKRLKSRALRAEALETIACSYLSVTLLLGLGANAAFGWWWADPVAALLMVPWLMKEGLEGISTHGCSH